MKIVEGTFSQAASGYDVTINLGAKPLCVLLFPATAMFSVNGTYPVQQIPCAMLRGSQVENIIAVSSSNSTYRLGYITTNGFTVETPGVATYLGSPIKYIAFIEEG